jgi:hypothetical protein
MVLSIMNKFNQFIDFVISSDSRITMDVFENEGLIKEAVEDVVESIISVVSDTEKSDGSRLYHDGKEFKHSVTCECDSCLNMVTTSLNVRRILFETDEESEPNSENNYCSDCGLSDEFARINHHPNFQLGRDWPRVYRCEICHNRNERSIIREDNDICLECGEINRSNNPCDCVGGWVIDREGNPENIDDEYIGEFENEEMPENNTEKVKEVKDTVKELGEIVYDIQDKISEGEYLKMMDLLQEVTNRVNNLE